MLHKTLIVVPLSKTVAVWASSTQGLVRVRVCFWLQMGAKRVLWILRQAWSKEPRPSAAGFRASRFMGPWVLDFDLGFEVRVSVHVLHDSGF